MLPGGGMSQELKARAGSIQCPEQLQLLLSSLSVPQYFLGMWFWCPALGKLSQTSSLGLSFTPAGSLILWNQSGFWAQKNVGWNPGPILISGVISGKRPMPVKL